MDKQERHGGGLVWPMILIAAGVVFLLNNLGLVSWGVWGTLWRFWPVLLIAAGLEILIGRRSLWGSALVALLLVAALVAAIAWGMPRGGATTVARTEEINLPLGDAQRGRVEISFGTGRLHITALPESAGLVEGTVDLGRDEELVQEFHQTGGVARVQLSSRGTWRRGISTSWDDEKVWDLRLNRDVPLELEISMGVGQADLDLTYLNLTNLKLEGGVGRADVTLPRRGRVQAEVDGGVGEITITIPAGMAARIRVDGGLGGVKVSQPYERRGDEYISPDYQTATDRVELDIDGGVGRITIRQGAGE